MQMVQHAYPVTLFTKTQRFEGVYRPVGMPFEDINNSEKSGFYLTDATFTALAQDSRFPPMTVPQVIVSRHDTVFFYFEDESAKDQFRLLARTELVVVYTAVCVLRGSFHLGAEQNARNMLDTMRGDFQPMTDVAIFPLLQTRITIPREHEMILINTRNIELYYPVATEKAE